MEDPLSMLLAAILLTICLAALFAAVAALFPVTVEITRRAADDQPGRSFGLGLVNILFLTGLTLALLSISEGPFLRFLALLVTSAGTVALTFGLAAVVGLTGERIAPQRSGLARIVLGTVVLSLGCLTPVVGWFGLLPYVACLGVGGFVLGLFRRRSGPPTIMS
jgi:hypothetical protein